MRREEDKGSRLSVDGGHQLDHLPLWNRDEELTLAPSRHVRFVVRPGTILQPLADCPRIGDPESHVIHHAGARSAQGTYLRRRPAIVPAQREVYEGLRPRVEHQPGKRNAGRGPMRRPTTSVRNESVVCAFRTTSST